MKCLETKEWTQLWLEYRPNEEYKDSRFFKNVQVQGFSESHPVIMNALEELKNAAFRMFGIETQVLSAGASESTENESSLILLEKEAVIPAEGFFLHTEGNILKITASDEKGVLYGVFHLLRLVSTGEEIGDINLCSFPECSLRMLNHWDNLDGSIERGYSGKSFFFQDGEILVNERTRDYARLVSSVGINAVVINNVNVFGDATELITDRYREPLSRMSEIFSGYGIRLFLCLNYASPIELGGLESCDPLEPEVKAWWKDRMAYIYKALPDLGGFLIKADSEGRPGPFTYGRTQAEGANMLAEVLKPYGGLVIWRCFVYNCTQDWRDKKTDRARAAYDSFHETDGEYLDNVILQCKNGPVDFQIREPVSPLFGGMKRTNQMLEVQIAQEYTGQQIDLCYLIPMFKEVLDFRTYCGEEKDTVADIICGRTFGNKNTGIAAVCNTGNDKNWTGDDLAAVNLYGFGRLAWDMHLTAEEIACEWIRQTFALSSDNEQKLLGMLLQSRETYEKYSSPLGIGWMVNPSDHYGPSVDGYEYSRWGTYHRSDHLGLGVDRSDKGTGYAQQYNEPLASMYNDPETCPEELLLFFHRVEYLAKLKNGKTLIQHIYDTHFEGAEEAFRMADLWDSMEEELDPEVFQRVQHRFALQKKNAREWRDQVNSYFFRKSGIADEKGREIF